MNNEDFEALARVLMGRVFIQLEASGRHVHVTSDQAQTLFGHGLTPERPLSQPGQYLAKERVTVMGPNGQFQNVAVLGPERKEAQVELSLTDARMLGVTAPVRPSGQVEDSPGCILSGPKGQVGIRQGIIAAQRHVHMTPEDAKTMGVQDGEQVKLQVYTHRPLIFQEVLVRVSPDFATFAHLDYDEANACGFQQGDLGRILP